MSRMPRAGSRHAATPGARRRTTAAGCTSRIALALAASIALGACGPAVPPPFPSSARPAAAALGASPPPTAPPTGTTAPATSAPAPSPTRPPLPPPRPEPPPPPTASRATTARLQALLARFVALDSAPGVSATVIFPDGTEWTGVAGFADLEARTPVTADTAFSVASVTKTFVAALILELSRESAFGLDDRIAVYLPELELDPAITIRMLLDHTSGLRDYYEHRLIDRALQDEPSVAWSPTRALGYLDEPYFDPGTGWRYSNTNYLVLGLLAQRVTGRRLSVELRERFLDPLGLSSMWYQAAETPRRPLAHGYRIVEVGNRLVPQDLDDGTGIAPFRSVITASGGAGSLAADSRDVARWAELLYGGDAIDDNSLAIMLAGIDAIAGHQPQVPYGLGVQAIPIAGHRAFGHSGRFLGFRAAMRWLPDEEVAIGVLTNQSRVELAPLVERMVKVILPPPGQCPCPRPF